MVKESSISETQWSKLKVAAVSPDIRTINDVTCSSQSLLAGVLPYAEVEFQAKFLENGYLPPFRGVSLRGGFGYYFKKTVCHVRSGNCNECIVRTSCTYSYIFEGIAPEERTIMRLYPYVPQPFVIITEMKEPTDVKAGQSWKFGLRLFGRAIEHFPYVAYSLMELGKYGLGKDKIKFDIEKITQTSNTDLIFQSGSHRLSKLKLQYCDSTLENTKRDTVTLEFITPAKLRIGGRDAYKVTFCDIIRSAIRRLSILTHFYGVSLTELLNTSEIVEKSSEIRTEHDQTQWFEFQRYSRRQGHKMTIGGLVGRMSFTGDLDQFLPLLALTEIANIGKATSFGFGRIAVS